MADQKKEISMEMRVLLAFALSAVILFLWVPIQKRIAPPPAPEKPAASQPAPAAPESKPPAAAQPKPLETAKKQRAAPPVTGVRQASQETETVVENDLYRVAFWNRGAVVKSWVLKNFQDSHGKPLELVNQAANVQVGFPFMIWVDDDAQREQLKNALFEVHSTSTQAPATITFEYSDGTLAARKEFRLDHGSYVAHVSSSLTQGGAPLEHELAWRGSFGDHSALAAETTTAVITAAPGKITRHSHSDIKTEQKLGGPFLYGGIEDMFFAAVFMPAAEAGPDARVPSVRTFRFDFTPAGKDKPVTLAGVGAGGAADNRYRVFVGPKSFDVLHNIYPVPGSERLSAEGQPVMTLGDLLDFGWFSFIAKPLFLALKWMYAHLIANYGWDIIIITIVINFILFPLKLKSMRSAMKMQKVAPQVKAIQEKYKKLKFNDPRKAQQNQEVMELYKQHGINPLGGCLPMVIQIPFLYAFYKVLAISIEMRHAAWVLWIHDLSAKDPYYILPIVMTATMYILQRMTPQTTTDPAQAKMFQLMPLIFGFMFMNVSAGLVLYWLMGNIVGIAQQWYINKVGLAPAAPRKPAPARAGKF